MWNTVNPTLRLQGQVNCEEGRWRAGIGWWKKRNGKLSITLFMESKLLWKAKWVEPKEAAF